MLTTCPRMSMNTCSLLQTCHRNTENTAEVLLKESIPLTGMQTLSESFSFLSIHPCVLRLSLKELHPDSDNPAAYKLFPPFSFFCLIPLPPISTSFRCCFF